MDTRIDIPLFVGNKIFENLEPSKPLIEGILWENDLVMLLGSEKAGKSILALQMASALTTRLPFLDKYSVPEKVPVLYVQTEGKRHQVIERIQRMQNAVEFDEAYFSHIPKKFLPLDIAEYFTSFVMVLDSIIPKPKVIIIDALYMAMSGDLIDNQAARTFLSKVAFIMDRYKSSVVIVHHESKPVFDSDTHQEVDRADKASYGSVFFRAIVDHILYLKMNRDKSRTLSCNTQRSGEVMDKEELILIEPNPLCFEIKGDYKAYEEVVKHCIKSNSIPVTTASICKATGLSDSAVRKATRHLFKDKVIQKSGYNPTLFSFINTLNT